MYAGVTILKVVVIVVLKLIRSIHRIVEEVN